MRVTFSTIKECPAIHLPTYSMISVNVSSDQVDNNTLGLLCTMHFTENLLVGIKYKFCHVLNGCGLNIVGVRNSVRPVTAHMASWLIIFSITIAEFCLWRMMAWSMLLLYMHGHEHRHGHVVFQPRKELNGAGDVDERLSVVTEGESVVLCMSLYHI